MCSVMCWQHIETYSCSQSRAPWIQVLENKWGQTLVCIGGFWSTDSWGFTVWRTVGCQEFISDVCSKAEAIAILKCSLLISRDF